jgi:hypothetical protein
MGETAMERLRREKAEERQGYETALSKHRLIQTQLGESAIALFTAEDRFKRAALRLALAEATDECGNGGVMR